MIKGQKVLLPMAEPLIRGYTNFAHLLSILQCYEKTLPWIYSNFIQVYMNKDLLKNSWGDFYHPMPYELRLSDTCKWIKNSRIERENFFKNPKRLLNFIEKELNKGNYIHLNIDQEQITSFEVDKKCHDSLVFGIDIGTDAVYVADVYKNGMYEKKVLNIKEFIDAYYSFDHKSEYDFLNGMIYLYKVKEECDIEFDIKNIENAIIEYRESRVPEYWRLYNFSNSKEVVFGLSVYDALSEYIERIFKQDVMYIDGRHFYLLMEHKKIMIERLKFLCTQKYYEESSMMPIIESYKKMSRKSKLIVNLLVKSFIAKNKNDLKKVLDFLHHIKQEEYDTLGRYLNIIKTDKI